MDSFPFKKEGSKGTALRSQSPGNNHKNGYDQGPDEVVRAIAVQSPRCRRARHVEEGAGIRPFLEPRKARHKQSDGPKQLPASQDREQVHRVAKMHYDLDDGIADYKQRSPMQKLRHPTCQKL